MRLVSNIRRVRNQDLSTKASRFQYMCASAQAQKTYLTHNEGLLTTTMFPELEPLNTDNDGEREPVNLLTLKSAGTKGLRHMISDEIGHN